jgi:hypothetical protein
MARAQTTPQLEDAITFGSAKVEMRAYGSTGAYTDLGVGTGIEVEETITPATLEPDNASPMVIDLSEHSVTFKMNLWELDFTKIYALRGGSSGLDSYSTQAAEAVTVTDERHVLTGTTGVRLDNRNGAGTVVTSVTVTSATDTACSQNTDYVLYVDGEGYTCIARVGNSTNLPSGNNAKIDYTYTPLASKTWSTGGKSDLGYIELKLTNVRSISGSDKTKIITIYKAQVTSGLVMKFPAAKDSTPLEYPLEMIAYDDATRTAGDQLFSVVDQQGV